MTPRETEKRQFGEVFTPPSLINEMLDTIEKYAKDTEFWKNPNNKILDPAAGIGNFPIVAYQKLMLGLQNVIKNKKDREKHIIENMLYMVELNPNNVQVMKKIFYPYKCNVITGSFIEDKKYNLDDYKIL